MNSLFLALAAAEAENFNGATSPNPPVGALVERDGRILGCGAHERAGTDHAEVKALVRAAAAHGSQGLRGATLYVTLEPCNHTGRTPPCTRAIVESGVTRVVFAERDPNREVAGGGAHALREAGLEVVEVSGHEPSLRLLEGFAHHCRTGRPWLVLKRALRMLPDGSLTALPEAGSRTFTSPESLRIAHLERRKSDAIITGIGTVLADLPLFTVRRAPDHANKRRLVVVLSRSGREAPADWLRSQAELGHEVLTARSPLEALEGLGRRGALRALLEAGPSVSDAFERAGYWNERLTFVRSETAAGPHDVVYRERTCSRES